MENIHQFPDGFESWIRNKSWSELNTEELKQLQDEQINEEEFLQLKQMLIQLELIEEETIQPKDELKNALLEAFEKGPGKPGRVISMPVWIATFAAAAAVLVFFVWFMPKEASKNTVADIPQISQTENNQIQSEVTSPSKVDEASETKTEEFIPMEIQQNSNNLAPIAVEEVEYETTTSSKVSEDLSTPNNNSIADDATIATAPMNNLNKEVIVESKAATTTTSMAQNFSTTSTSISSQLFSSGSTAQNFDQSVQLTPNLTLVANKNMLDVLVTVY
jgi:hypothetical protein